MPQNVNKKDTIFSIKKFESKWNNLLSINNLKVSGNTEEEQR